nr:RNA-directed DNA polymerase, eukaryota [Tanacetum cinerariifolium]
MEESDMSSIGDGNEIEKDADSLNANSDDDLEDVLKKLNNSKEDEESNVGSPKINVKDSQITKEANTSDLSCPHGFEHLKRESLRRCSTSFAKHQNKDIKVGKTTIGDCYMVNIYGPHDPLAKFMLWNQIHDFMQSSRGKYIVLGDMNGVRNSQERYGSIFSRSEDEVFNTLFNNTNLTDHPMGGHSFTWMNKQGMKLSKLDHFEEQRRGYHQMKEKNADMYEKITRFIEDMRRVPEANTTPIIANQHFGVSDISGFQRYQGVPSAFHTLANNNSFFNMATPLNLQTPNQSNWLSPSSWQTPNQSYLGTPNSQPPIPSQPDDVTITDVHQTDNYFNYETVDPDKILIRERTENANWTLAKSSTICLHPENNRFMILTDPHNIRTLDGSVRPFPSWNDVTWVYMPINAGGVHWVTGVINLTDSIFYVFDSMESESRMLMLEQQVNNWSPIINNILETRGYFNATGR